MICLLNVQNLELKLQVEAHAGCTDRVHLDCSNNEIVEESRRDSMDC